MSVLAAAVTLEPLMTVGEVASAFKVSKSLVYKMAEAGKLPAIRIGALLRFEPAAVRRALQNGVSSPATSAITIQHRT